MKIKGSKILISGGSLGIGKAAAELLVKSGAEVIITGRNQKRLDIAARETGAIPFVADVSKIDQVEATYRFVEKKWGTMDCLVNNAGIGSRSTQLTEVSEEDFLGCRQGFLGIL